VTAGVDGVLVGTFADSDFSSLSPEILVNPGWTTWNARASVKLTRQFTATLAIDNIGDHQYMEPLGYRALGRAIRAGVRAGF
jgi:outer membrane receptor protein involved in Fe transport